MNSLVVVIAWIGATTLILSGCADGNEPPEAGAVEVQVAPTGGLVGSDRFRVRLDGRSESPVSSGEATFFSPVVSGEHVVTLDEYPSRCRVEGGTSRAVVVTAGDTAAARFDVDCPHDSGELTIRLVVSGEDQDPSGYTVVLDGERRDSGRFAGSVAFGVASGSHSVVVTDRTASCPVNGDTARVVPVPPGGAATVDFEITCSLSPPAGRGQEIVFETTRAGLDSHGAYLFQLYSVNVDGTGLRLLSAVPVGTQTFAAWSPDGARLLFSASSEGFDNQVFIMNADGSSVAPYLDVDGQAAWSPDMGRLALSVLDEEPDDEFEPNGLGTVPSANPTPDGVDYFTFAGELSRPSWSPDGTRLVYVRRNFFPDGEGGSRDMEILDLSTRVSDTLPISLKGFEDPQWSPDGEWLLFSASTDFGPQDLYLMRADGTDPPIQLTDTLDDEITPAWSPDGRQIAFATNRDGNYEIYVMNADGTHPVRLTNDPASDGRPAWRP